MSFGTDTAAILRHLETSPQDKAAINALHDCLLDDGRDEVLAAGVHWLVVNDVWIKSTKTPVAVERTYQIDIYIDRGDLGINRRPFNGPVFGSTVAETLRAFSGYLWGFRVWVADQLFGDAPVAAGKKPGPIPGIPEAQPLSPDDAESIREMVEEVSRHRVRPWRTWTLGDPPVRWKVDRRLADNTYVPPATTGDMWYLDNTTGERVSWAVTRSDTKPKE
jgi:hypothetical protein